MMNNTFYHLEGERGNEAPQLDELERARYFITPGLEEVHTQFGILTKTKAKIGRKRFYLTHKSPETSKPDKLLIHLHGSRGSAWREALSKTRWIEKAQQRNMLIVFGQSQGEAAAEPFIHPVYQGISFGQMYWEIRDYLPEFREDLGYIQEIIDEARTKHPSIKKILVSGHSNGGVFTCLLGLYLIQKIDGLFSSMGGTGWDEAFCLDFSTLREGPRPKFYFLSAQHDVHLQPSKIAYELFREEGYESVLKIMKDRKHLYYPDQEDEVLDHLLK